MNLSHHTGTQAKIMGLRPMGAHLQTRLQKYPLRPTMLPVRNWLDLRPTKTSRKEALHRPLLILLSLKR